MINFIFHLVSSISTNKNMRSKQIEFSILLSVLLQAIENQSIHHWRLTCFFFLASLLRHLGDCLTNHGNGKSTNFLKENMRSVQFRASRIEVQSFVNWLDLYVVDFKLKFLV